MIKGGYIIKSRNILNSALMRKAPVVRETFDWLLLNACFKGRKVNGYDLKKGQLFTTIKDIIDGLSWFVGYRKEGYSERQMRVALNVLTKENMIVTTKVINGIIVTVSNFNNYQDFKNYEGKYECNNEGNYECNNEGNQGVVTIEERKRKKERSKEYIYKDLIQEFSEYRKKIKKPMTEKAKELADKKLFTLAGSNEELAKEIVEQSIFNNWTGLFELKNNNFKKQDPYNGKTPEQIKAEFFKDL